MSEHESAAAPPRYVVGIDLGTTNSAAAFIDAEQTASVVETFAVPQITAPGVVESRETLPSFHYEAAPGEFAAGALRLPWGGGRAPKSEAEFAVGRFARDHGETVPGRLIASAKSWLCHAGVDRTAELLPWHGAADVTRLSPVDAAARYLGHFRDAWNHRFPAAPLELQDVAVTLPASFDEVARELTVRAAKQAGLPRIVLLEEPQAAFYAWIAAHRDAWAGTVAPGQKILICDIGGGTSDFTLIRVRADRDGRVQFHRIAVGDHLILGGDNLDLALAHFLEQKLSGEARLEARTWSVLLRSCRRVKETLLGANPPERMTVNVAGGGSRLIGGGRTVEITADEARQVLVEGFLPRCSLDDKPQARRSGFQEFGLPYAPDAAMTRYLAAFLAAHRHTGEDPATATTNHDGADYDPARPDVVLFNGGFFESPLLRERLLEVLGSWFPDSAGKPWRPLVLENDRLDLAVARGAAYYGLVRRGQGVKINAGLARTYYVGVDTNDAAAPSAVCLLPAGAEEGQTLALSDRTFALRIREPVEFPLYYSSTRLTDVVGQVVPIDPLQMTSLPPIRTVLQTAKKGTAETVDVTIEARLTEIGTLELGCRRVDGPSGAAGAWRLQFDVRAAVETERAAHAGVAEQSGFVDAALVEACREPIRRTFAANDPAQSPASLVKRIEAAAELRRSEWPVTLLRELWHELFDVEVGRKFSEEHEARWLWLAGFTLRPGYGLAVDDWRTAQMWRLLQGKRYFHGVRVRVETLILWRRIAGGLTAGQQRALAEPLASPLRTYLASLRAVKAGGTRKPDFGFTGHESAEVWRLLGSLELLDAALKRDAAEAALVLAAKEKTAAVQDALIWAVGRLGARVPMYGPLNVVAPSDSAAGWCRTLMDLKGGEQAVAFALMTLARKTGDRYRDVDESTRKTVLNWLDRNNAAQHLRTLVAEGGSLAGEEQGRMFGESLPTGLRLTS